MPEPENPSFTDIIKKLDSFNLGTHDEWIINTQNMK